MLGFPLSDRYLHWDPKVKIILSVNQKQCCRISECRKASETNRLDWILEANHLVSQMRILKRYTLFNQFIPNYRRVSRSTMPQTPGFLTSDTVFCEAPVPSKPSSRWKWSIVDSCDICLAWGDNWTKLATHVFSHQLFIERIQWEGSWVLWHL